MRRLRIGLLVSALILAVTCASAAAAPAGPGPATNDGGASWVSAPALAPPTPQGAQPSPYPVALGYVGDIAFYAPNRGLLITAGSGVVSPGLYAYNGVNWHQLSTVCGGSDGRIAFAGPDEFWTISDQRPGQVLPNGNAAALQDVSLCHFLNGVVVGSYALPLNQPNSYKPMNAAACDTASDCWFGGNLDSAGAFHLHWDGTNVTQVDASQDHQIASMTVDQNSIYESVQVRSTDDFGDESTSNPPIIHVINPSEANPFVDLFPTDTQGACAPFCPPLPEYGTTTTGQPVPPYAVDGMALSSDSSAGAADPALWAAAGPLNAGSANPIVLYYQDGNWTQVVPNLTTFPNGDVPITSQEVTPSPVSTAADPGESAAWIAVIPSDNDKNQAYVDRVALGGTTAASFTDEDTLGDAQGVGPRGSVSAIACPAAADCWVATTEGWLFHLTDGTQLTQDTDPNYNGVITYRPPDGGVPDVVPSSEPVTTTTTTAPPTPTTTPLGHKHVTLQPVITKIGKSKIIDHGTLLVLTFTVTAKAHVQILGLRKGKIVAKSADKLLKPGRRTLTVKLNVHRYPTAIKFKTKRLVTEKKNK